MLYYTVHPSVAPIEALMVNLVYVFRAGAMKKLPLIVLVFVLVIQVFLLDVVGCPESLVLDSLDLIMWQKRKKEK